MNFYIKVILVTIMFSNTLLAGEQSSLILPTSDSPFGIKAGTLSASAQEDLKMPEPEPDGKIKTLNAMGFMTPEMDHFTEDFVEFASHAKLPVLDGGAAYGVATIPALKKGATVIANDIDIRHLLFIVNNSTLSSEEKNKLYLNNDALPYKANFPENSLEAILLCRVMHFFTPDEVDAMFKQAKKWLAPGGRFYVVMMTPYHYSLTGFSKIYEERLRNGDKWPGIITSMTTDYLPQNAGKIPDYLHVLEGRLFSRLGAEHGFIVKKIELFGHHVNPKENGLGYIGAIFIKEGDKDGSANKSKTPLS